MAIKKTTLHPSGDNSTDLYPETSIDQVVGLQEYVYKIDVLSSFNLKNGTGTGSVMSANTVDDDGVNYSEITDSISGGDCLPEASGFEAFAMGKAAKATGKRSFAYGNKVSATANTSIAIGQLSKSTGSASVAIGSNVTASGERSFACCDGNYATGSRSFAAGWSNKASGAYSAVFGVRNNANQSATFVVGIDNISTAYAAITGGTDNINTSEKSIVMGTFNNNKAASAIVAGRHNICECENGLVVGQYNSPNRFTIFQIGNGNDENYRSNAFEVYDNGRVKIYGTPTENNDAVRLYELERSTYIHNIKFTISDGSRHYTIYISITNSRPSSYPTSISDDFLYLLFATPKIVYAESSSPTLLKTHLTIKYDYNNLSMFNLVINNETNEDIRVVSISSMTDSVVQFV